MAQSTTQIARRTLSLPRRDPHKPKGGPPRPSRNSRRRAIVLILVHVVFLVHIAHWKIAGSTITPVEPSEAMQTLELGYLNAGFVLFVVAILATMILGRFFCGWTCHLVAYQDLAATILGKIGIRPRPVRSRLLMLIPFGAAFYMFIWPQIARMLDGREFPALVNHFATEQFWATFPGPVIATLTILVDGFLIIYLLGAKGFCTYGCPYGAFFGIADRFALGQIRVNDNCEQCGHCTATCSSNVRVHEEVAKYKRVVDPGCMKCLDCVSVCPKNALTYAWGRPSVFGPRPTKKRKRVWDFSWPEEVAMALLFFGGLYAFRGLYDVVPFLFALGLSVIAALAGILLWRVLRRSIETFQHHALRRDGRWTRQGIALSILAPTFLLFTGHSAWVQFHAREGERLLIRAEQLEPAARAGIIESSLGHLQRADQLGLISVAKIHLQMGAIFRSQGRLSEAETQMRHAIAADGSMITPRYELADMLIRRQSFAEAEQVLLQILERRPEDEQARRWLEGVRARM